jgi:hypothetical protein
MLRALAGVLAFLFLAWVVVGYAFDLRDEPWWSLVLFPVLLANIGVAIYWLTLSDRRRIEPPAQQ